MKPFGFLVKTTQWGRNRNLELGGAIPPSVVETDSLQRKLISSSVPLRMFDVVSPHSLIVRYSSGYTVYGRQSARMEVRPESESESTSSRRGKKTRKRTEGKGKKQTTEEISGFSDDQSVDSLLVYIEGSDQNNEKLTTTDRALHSSFKNIKKAKQELESSSKRRLHSPKHGACDFDHGQFDSSLDDNVGKISISNAVSPGDASASFASVNASSSPLSWDTSPKTASSMQSSLHIYDTSASADSLNEDFIPVIGRKAKYKRESASFVHHGDQSSPSNGGDNGRFQRRQDQQLCATPPSAARDRRCDNDVSFDEVFARSTACNGSFRRRDSASPGSHAVDSGVSPSPPSLVFSNQNSTDRDLSINDANSNAKIDKPASNTPNSVPSDCMSSHSSILHHSQRLPGPPPTSAQPQDGARLSSSAVNAETGRVSSTNIISSSAQIKTMSSANVRSSLTNAASSASGLPCTTVASDRSAAATAVLKPSSDEVLLCDSVLSGTRAQPQQSPHLFGADVANRLEFSHPNERQLKPSMSANAEAAAPSASAVASRRHKQSSAADATKTQPQPPQASSARANRNKAMEFCFEPSSSDASVVEGLSFGFHDVSDDDSAESVSSRKVSVARPKPNFDASETISAPSPSADPMLDAIVSFVKKAWDDFVNTGLPAVVYEGPAKNDVQRQQSESDGDDDEDEDDEESDSESDSEPMPERQVWAEVFFHLDTNRYRICRLCNRRLKFINLFGLKQHLRIFHMLVGPRPRRQPRSLENLCDRQILRLCGRNVQAIEALPLPKTVIFRLKHKATA